MGIDSMNLLFFPFIHVLMFEKGNKSFVTDNVITNEKGHNNGTEKKEIIKTWLTGQHSCTLIIPKALAKSCGLDEPSHVIVEPVSNGLLIRRLEI
jgi:hypothetical protein